MERKKKTQEGSPTKRKGVRIEERIEDRGSIHTHAHAHPDTDTQER